MIARKPAPVPFRLLRLAYEQARDNALDSVGGIARLREEWPQAVRDVVRYDRASRAKVSRARKVALPKPPHELLQEVASAFGSRLCGLLVAHAGRVMHLEVAEAGWHAWAQTDEPIEYTEEGAPVAWAEGVGPTPEAALDACAAAADAIEEGRD